MWAFIISGIVPLFHSAVQERKSQAGSCAMAVSTGYTRNNTAKTVCMYLCRAGRFVSIYTAPHLSMLLFSAMVCFLSLNSSVHRVHFGHWDIDRGALRFEDNTELYTFLWWKFLWIIFFFSINGLCSSGWLLLSWAVKIFIGFQSIYLFVYLFILCALQCVCMCACARKSVLGTEHRALCMLDTSVPSLSCSPSSLESFGQDSRFWAILAIWHG